MPLLTLRQAMQAYLQAYDFTPTVLGVHETRRPEDAVLPCAVLQGPITSPRDPNGQQHSGARLAVIPEMQVDLFQRKYGDVDLTGLRPDIEDPLLPGLVAVALVHAQLVLDVAPARIYGLSLLDGPRELPEPQELNLVHHVIQIQVHQDLAQRRP